MEQFGGLAISFRQLLHNLEHHCGCRVEKLSVLGDIPDTDGSVAGTLFQVTRGERATMWHAHIEVYSFDLPVLPDLLRSICVQLNLEIEQVWPRYH